MSSYTSRRGETFSNQDQGATKENRPANTGRGARGVGVSKKLPTKDVRHEEEKKQPGKRMVGKIREPVPGVPQRKLILKPRNKAKAKPVITKPLPFITKTNLYDDHWAAKQERGFTKWLNFILAPTDPFGNIITPQGKPAGQLVFSSNTPAGSRSQLTTPLELLLKRRLSRWRQSACCLFQSDPYNEVIERLEIEIETGRLNIKDDHSPHSDVGAREEILQLLTCYNPIWLRLGLEAVFGEIIEVPPGYTMSQTLTVYIQSRLLANDQIADMYYQPTITGRYGQGYSDAVCQFILKRFLQLVLLLDKAKLTRLIDHDPCLFCKEASVKSSREVLLSFSRKFLSGEGDITKHLQHLGYSVSHVQSPLHEVDYSVKNLATDLQDGLRLIRLVELLSENWGLSQQLRVPAATKMQKVHNVEVCLGYLRNRLQLPSMVSSQSIAEGHREKTLALLWSIIFHFKVKLAVNEKELRKEIASLEKCKPHPIASQFSDRRRSSIEANIFFQSPELSLLLQWCRAVCAIYGVPVNNFSTSFSDGRVFCYMLHHYQPALLPLEEIGNETTLSQPAEACCGTPEVVKEEEENYEPWTATFSPTTGVDRKQEKLLATERANFKLLAQKLPLLGGVPLMVHSKDMSNTMPDEKVVIVCVTYLCQQLLLLGHETRAATCLQRSWRKYSARRKEERRKAILARQRLNLAASTVQRRWRARKQMEKQRAAFTLLRRAAITLQRVFKQWQAARQHKAASRVQATVKKWIARRLYLEQRHAAVTIQRRWRLVLLQRKESKAATCIQACYRGYHQRKQYATVLGAVTILQTHFKAYILGKRDREAYYEKQRACLVLHRSVRSWLAYRAHKKVTAATTIQACFRGHRERKRYVAVRNAVLVLQRHLKATLAAKKQRDAYLMVRQATVTIQAHVRRWHVQKLVCQQQSAAVLIQARVRSYLAQRHYHTIKQSVLTLQSYTHAMLAGRQQRKTYLILRAATITLQSHFRRWTVQKKLSHQHRAAVLIQAKVRSYLAQQHYHTIKQSVLTLQSYTRAMLAGRQQRKAYLLRKAATITLQSHFRRWTIQKQLSHQHRAAIVIQARVRSYLAQQHYHTIKQSVLTLQSYTRAMLAGRQQRKTYLMLRVATITLQSHFRRWIVQKQLSHQHRAAVLIQARVRSYLAQRHYHTIRQSIITLQTHFRATQNMKQQRIEYLSLRKATITLQSHVRRWMVQQWQSRQQSAAITIQAFTRCFLVHRQYLAVRQSALILQAYIRATLKMRRQRESYLTLRKATICIQSHFRRWRVQEELSLQRSAAVIIQACVRGFVARKHFIAVRQSTLILQSQLKATLSARHQRKKFLEMRQAAVVLQSHVRRWRVQRELARQQEAAVLIQACFRSHQQQQRFQRQRQAAVCLQHQWRAKVVMKHDRTAFIEVKKASTTIQAFSRGLLARRRYHNAQQACRLLQAHIKGYLTWRWFQRQRTAATTLQAAVRCFIAKKRYHQQRNAAIVMQAYCRGWLARKRAQLVQQQISSAVRIQAAWRRHSALKSYQQLQRSSVVIQSAWRCLTMRKRYQEMRRAAILIQSHVRSQQTMKKFAHIRTAAIAIQATTRCYLARSRYLQQKKAAITIQQAFREYCTNRRDRAATLLQASWKGYLARRWFNRQRQSTIIIQSCYRMHQARRSYLEMHSAAVLLQAVTRGCLARRDFRRRMSAVLAIQSAWRAWYCRRWQAAIKIQATARAFLAQRTFQKKRRAAITIQSYLRCHWAHQAHLTFKTKVVKLQATWRACQQRRRYVLMLNSAVTIQQKWTACLYGRKMRERFQATKMATIMIQRVFRGYLVRKTIARWHTAAVTIQSAYRQRLVLLNQSTTIIQTVYRGYSTRQDYLTKRTAATIIQSRYRATVLAHQEHQTYLRTRRTIITAQAIVRGWLTRLHYNRTRSAIITLQKNVRMWQATRQYSLIRTSALLLQSYSRGLLARRQYAQLHEQRRHNTAATLIQTAVRGYLTRREYRQRRAAAVVLQRHTRGCLARREYRCTVNSLVRLQSHVRSFLTRRRYFKMRAAICVIQQRTRALLLARKTRTNYLNLRRAAITIQTSIRCWQAQRRYNKMQKAVQSIQQWYRYRHAVRSVHMAVERQHCAATVLQAVYRAHRQHSHYLTMRQSAVIIQSSFHGYIAHKRYHRLQDAAVTIQQHWRATLLMRMQVYHYQLMREAAIFIQHNYWSWRRSREQRREYLSIRNAAITVQRCYRLHQQRRKLRATVCIQRAVRQFLAYKRQKERQAYLTRFSLVAHRHLCVVRCQQWWRCQIARKVYQAQLRQVVLVQSVVRGWLVRRSYQRIQNSAHLIQRVARGMLVRQHVKRMRSSALTIQSAWRGWCVRKHVNSRAVRNARERIARANAAAQQQMTLRNRLPSMLDSLQHCTYLSTVVDVLKSIELMTSVSERCSLAVVEDNATLVLYDYISRTNRSRPALEVGNICISILLNLCKWQSTSAHVLTEQVSLTTLVDFMVKVHLTQPDLMLQACKLLHCYTQLAHAQPLPEVCQKKVSLMRNALGRKVKQKVGRPQSSSFTLYQNCFEYVQKINTRIYPKANRS